MFGVGASEEVLSQEILGFLGPLVDGVTKSTTRLEATEDTAVVSNIWLVGMFLAQTSIFGVSSTGLVDRKSSRSPLAASTATAQNSTRVTSASNTKFLGSAVVEGEQGARTRESGSEEFGSQGS